MQGNANQPQGYPQGNQYNYGQPSQQFPNQPQGQYYNPNIPPQNAYKPNSYMVWAILTTILCCLPFGVVAIVYASKVDSLWFAGRVDEARRASENAKNWSIASAVTSIVVSVILVVITLVTN